MKSASILLTSGSPVPRQLVLMKQLGKHGQFNRARGRKYLAGIVGPFAVVR
jgi:hypothetical protein